MLNQEALLPPLEKCPSPCSESLFDPGARAAGSRKGSLTLSAVLSSDVRPEVVTKPGKDRAVGGRTSWCCWEGGGSGG